MASDTEQTPTTDEAAVTKPKRRRASSKAAAPAQAAAAPAPEETTAAAAPAGDGAQAPDSAAAEPPPAKKAARKRATKKAAPAAAEHAAPAEAAAADAAVDAGSLASGEGPEGPASAEAPTKKPVRKTATRKRTSKAAKAVESAPVLDASVLDASVLDAADEADLLVLDVSMGESEPAAEIDEIDETDETDEAARVDEATPVAPSFGLLFQPPEPTVARRRRATAPSQAPSERPAQSERPVPTEEAVAAAPVDSPSEQAPEPEQDESRSATDQIGDDIDGEGGSRRRRRGGRGRRGRAQTDDDGGSGATPSDTGDVTSSAAQASPGDDESADAEDGDAGSSRRRRRRRRGAGSGEDDPPGTVTRVREVRSQRDEPTAVKGSTRLEAKKQRRREGREAGRRRTVMTEAEFLSRRESVDRVMVVRGRGDRTQIGVLEDGVLVEHYVSRETTASMAGNVYLGRVQNVLPSMEAAFVDIGKGRNAVLYAGEVNWDAAGLEGGQARRIEHALKSGDTVLVQVTKDPIGHKGARLTSQISLPGRYVVYVPEGSMTGISRKLPDTERARLKGILKEIVPDSAGVIVRTAAEGASEEELTADVERLTQAWEKISAKAESAAAKKAGSGGSPMLLHGEPDLTVRVIRDVFTEDFSSLVVSGEKAWSEVSDYVQDVAPDLAPRLSRWTSEEDVFASHRIDEQIAKAMDRKVWLPSGGSLVIDRTEAMTVVDVNTGKFIGSGGNLEETVTKNNLEAAEEIVRQLRLRDIGGIIVVDFIDMVLEANRDLVVRRLLECLGRDRTKHQVAEVTSLGLVQMTRKRVGSGLIEVFSEPCEHCNGSGVIVHTEPIDRSGSADQASGSGGSGGAGGSRPARGRRGTSASGGSGTGGSGSGGSGSNGSGSNGSGSGGSGNGGSGNGGSEAAARTPSGPTAAQIAAAAHAAALRRSEHEGADAAGRESAVAVADAVADAVVEAVSGAAPARSENHDDVSSVPEAPAPEPFPEPVADAVVEPVVPPVAEPVTRARRKRGRVVAPAGPPRPVGDADGSEAADGASETESPTA